MSKPFSCFALSAEPSQQATAVGKRGWAEMQKRTFIVTGGNTGLGFACARHIASHSENLVVIACRDVSKAENAADRLRASGCGIQILPLDLASLDSVRQFVSQFEKAHLPPLAGLVCNAGVQQVKTPTKTKDGFESTLESIIWVIFCLRISCFLYLRRMEELFL
jgi:NAD(P)-dependent dehydrogenase (short-subunit alcohol dehydrogenase family)